ARPGVLKVRWLHALTPQLGYHCVQSLPEGLDVSGLVQDREDRRVARCLRREDVLDRDSRWQPARADPLDSICEELDPCGREPVGVVAVSEQIDDQLADNRRRVLMHGHTLEISLDERHAMMGIVPKVGLYPHELVEDRAPDILLHMDDL